MRVNLIVPVYNGGEYWSDCWESIKNNIDLFDNVFISFNKCDLQSKDIDIANDFQSEKIIKFIRNESYGPKEHAIKILEDIGSYKSDFFLFLCHDDLLNRDGIIQLLKMDITPDCGVFGAQEYFYDDGSSYNYATSELMLFTNGIKPLQLSLLDMDKTIEFNLSGIVIHSKTFQNCIKVLKFVNYGYRSDNLFLSNPWIERVYQVKSPIVKIREHLKSQGKNEYKLLRAKDNILYFFIQYLMADSSYSRKRFLGGIITYLGYGRKYFINLSIYLFYIQFSCLNSHIISQRTYKIILLNLSIIKKGFRYSLSHLKKKMLYNE